MHPLRRARLRAVATLLLAVVAVTSSSALRAQPMASPVELHYDVYGGGLRLMSMAVVVDQRGDTYRMSGTFRTRGIADVFVGMLLRSEVQGRLVAGVPRPARYWTEGVVRGQERRLSMEFQRGAAPRVEFEPPDTEKRTPIAPPQLVDTVDTLSGILQVSRALAAGADCTQRVPAFDGKRRFDLVLTDRGFQDLRRSSYSVYEGPARLCHIRQERIGGFVVGSDDKDQVDEGEAWIATVLPETPPVPVRIEFKSGWGRSILHLVEIRAPTGFRRLS